MIHLTMPSSFATSLLQTNKNVYQALMPQQRDDKMLIRQKDIFLFMHTFTTSGFDTVYLESIIIQYRRQ